MSTTNELTTSIDNLITKEKQQKQEKQQTQEKQEKQEKHIKHQVCLKIGSPESLSDLPTLPLSVESFGLNVAALIDSGAAGNFISEKCVSLHSIPIVKKRRPVSVQLADASVCPSNNCI